MGAVTVVFDTNVLVSAAGFGGTPEKCVTRAFEDDVRVVVSRELLEEFRRVLAYDHLPFSEREQDDIPIAFLTLSDAESIDPDCSFDVLDDPDDNKFLECAVAANADYLVSGDEQHVQPLGAFRGVRIVSPSEFLDEIS